MAGGGVFPRCEVILVFAALLVCFSTCGGFSPEARGQHTLSGDSPDFERLRRRANESGNEEQPSVNPDLVSDSSCTLQLYEEEEEKKERIIRTLVYFSGICLTYCKASRLIVL